MELITPISVPPSRLGILAGSFNPPTVAHLALAEAALRRLDAVLLVLPGQLPHKEWAGATPEERVGMLSALAHGRLGVAVSRGGLYIEIVREAREHFPHAEMSVVCGRDAAERISTWDYGTSGRFEDLLREFRMLVAARRGGWVPAAEYAHAVEALDAGCWDEHSSTAARSALARGDASWRELVPGVIHDWVERIYR